MYNDLSLFIGKKTSQILHMRKISGIFLSCALATVLSSLPGTALATPEEAAFLQKVAEQYILAQFRNRPNDNVRIEVKAARLDDRRDYGGKCEGYLTAELQGREVRSNSTVKIVCSKPDSAFTVYIPVTVKRMTPTLVTSRTMSQGETIRRDDLSQIFMDESQAMPGIINSYAVLVGSKLKKEVKSGMPIRANYICVVCKGEKVTIEARSGALHLRTSGVAMEDGNMNQSIRIKNSKSNKVIYGKVVGPSRIDVSI